VPKRVLINGAFGRMGQLACHVLEKHTDFVVVAKTGRHDCLDDIILATQPDIVVDLTTAAGVWETAQTILQHPVYPIIGTSGLKKEQITQLVVLSQKKKQGGLIVPNFSIGAILQMRCAASIARYFSSAEIVETHHETKLDRPSGTALRTAEHIQEVNACQAPIHSIRLPGFVAEQEVIFGGPAETLKITHHVSNREAYMPGLVLACQKVMTFEQIYYGLEYCLES